MRKFKGVIKAISAVLILSSVFCCCLRHSFTSNAAGNYLTGGGYAASDQNKSVSYWAEIYDATNGLPSSDANYILGAADGYIWIGGYSGIIRYDGSTFERLDTSDGFTSGRALFEDSKGRIWVGTNDNGVVVMDKDGNTHLTYKEGLPSSSIRAFAEDSKGNIYIGSTAGVCYVDENMNINNINDRRMDKERVLRLESDVSGRVYGLTNKGVVFAIDDQHITGVYESEDLGTEKVTTILADPYENGKVYLGTESNKVYYGDFGEGAAKLKQYSVDPLEKVRWLSYDCGRVWVASDERTGYIDGDEFHLLNDLPMDSAIEMMTSDYQGNLWYASSTQGVMKIVSNSFVNLSERTGIDKEVTNTTCIHNGRLYIGTDDGLDIIDKDGSSVRDKLTYFIGDARVRCITADSDGNLWLAVFNDDLGVVCLTADDEIRNYTTEDGMPGNEIRCVVPSKEGGVIVGTNSGVAVIKNDMVERSLGALSGIKNTVILTVEEGDNGEIYAGSDGDGIYVIEKDNKITRLGRDEGLTSDVVMRIKKDDTNGVYWIVTSNSIEYLKDGVIKNITTFPYNNNYDLYFDDSDNMWILSSYGVYTVKIADMLNDSVTDYRLYTAANGMTSIPTSNSYNALDDDGTLYIAGRSGVCMVNINTMHQGTLTIRSDLCSIDIGDEKILPNEDGVFMIPKTQGRIRMNVSVIDFSLENPTINIFLEGKEADGITVRKSELKPLEYTGLKYGKYTLHVMAYDNSGNLILNDSYRINKEAAFSERPLFMIFVFLAFAALVAFLVWRVMKGTVIQRQYVELRKAKEEAERANAARTAFMANISNEIITPINTIMGMNEMTLRENGEGVPKPYYLSVINYALDIRKSSETLLTLVNGLLDMSLIESGRMKITEKEYATQDLLRSVISEVRIESIQKELTFDVDTDEMLPVRLKGDAGKIRKILMNLLSNSIKYTEFGGITLKVSMTERKDDVCKLRFSVCDTGIGIDKSTMDTLFTAYEQLDEEKRNGILGTGLSLDISKKMAELMGGDITCESEVNKGSEFTFVVSQKIIDDTPMGEYSESGVDNARGTYRSRFVAPDADILVVDESLKNVNLIKGLLRPTEVFVSTALSGEEALEKIKDTRFHVIFIDEMLPTTDGTDLVEKIRTRDKEIPVYAITSRGVSDGEDYSKKGYSGYLTKPLSCEVLEKTIMNHIPETMMEKPEEKDEGAENEKLPEELAWLETTEGIHVRDGIINSGGVNGFIESLKLFRDTVDSNVAILKEAYSSEDIKLYTLKVHALKNSARIAGAKELSVLAGTVEAACTKGDRKFVEENSGKLLDEYEKFKDKLSKI
ncbi:MAG: response regulator [Lachnospiraceae bacterium]|nr:response regulator [Lachnospiraceae bacterium]